MSEEENIKDQENLNEEPWEEEGSYQEGWGRGSTHQEAASCRYNLWRRKEE